MTPAKAMVRPSLSRYLPALLIVAAMGAFYALGLHRYLSLQGIIDNREALAQAVAAHGVLAIAIFAAVYAAAVAVSFPGASLLSIAAGFLFGIMAGGTVVVIAATLGACTVFLAARTSLGEGMANRAGPFLARLRDGFRDDAFSYLLALRLAPVFPFWLVNLAPALLGVELRTYALATLIGIIPGSFAFTAIGAGLDSVIAAQKVSYDACLASGASGCQLTIDPSALVTHQLLLALGGLAVVAMIPIALKKWRGRPSR
jgi:uncharacterized membrane protein YdjX (TVP38/TMEM64 family)